MGDTKDPAAIPLAKIMMDHGYSCCSSPTAVRNLLNQIGITSPDSGEILREDDVAQVFGMMARTHANLEQNSSNWTPSTESTDSQVSWEIENFVTTLVELVRVKINSFQITTFLTDVTKLHLHTFIFSNRIWIG